MCEKNTHEHQGGLQVFIGYLHKVAIVLVGSTVEFVVEFDTGAAGSSEEVRKARWQCLEHAILQTGKQKRGKQKFGGGRGVSRTHAFGLMVGSPTARYGEQGKGLKKGSC